jgi:YD repeat-containing protein
VLLVRDYSYINTGGYILYRERMNNPCNVASTLACDQAVAGSVGILADPPPWKIYRFTASANDAVSIRVGKTSIETFTPFMELYGPTGDFIASTSSFFLDRVLTASGTYTVLLRDSSNANSGDYLLSWQRGNNPCNPIPMSCGQVIADSLSVAEVDVYAFTASAGDNVVLTLTRTLGGLDPYLELYNSGGTRIAYQYTTSGNQVAITQTLSGGGSYTVFASDHGAEETGSYTLKFQKNSNYCPEVTVTAPNGGEFIKGGSSFTITWTSSSPRGVSSHEIRLSTDGGQTFPNVVATGLGGSTQSFDWSVPTDINNAKARIRVTATDTSGMSTPDESDTDFVIYQGIDRTYVYDELSRLIRIIYEDGKIVNYTYDAAGNRITLTSE